MASERKQKVNSSNGAKTNSVFSSGACGACGAVHLFPQRPGWGVHVFLPDVERVVPAVHTASLCTDWLSSSCISSEQENTEARLLVAFAPECYSINNPSVNRTRKNQVSPESPVVFILFFSLFQITQTEYLQGC